MNLFERFWQTLDERREPGDGGEPLVEITLTAVHPPDGVQSEAARDLTSIVRRAPRKFPPFVVSQPAITSRPFCLVYTVSGADMPQFHELFEQYVDKNAFIAETFLRLRPHCELPYVLFLHEKSFFLYDAALEELLRWGSDFVALEELFLQPIAAKTNVLEFWNAIPRKTFAQRSEEFGRWIDLWKVGIGARTNASPAFMQNLMQKVILLFLYDLHFGLQEPELSLRTNFLDQRPPLKRSSKVSALSAAMPFDGIAWLHEASAELRDRYKVACLEWTQAESTFFSLMGAETRAQFSQFILELFLQSQCKFAARVQADVFSDANSRLKLWKFSVTETLNIKRRLQADDYNVYEPIWIDLEESGLGWALCMVEQVLEFWKERCTSFADQLAGRKPLQVQFDMFQQPDLEAAKIPLPGDLFETAFATSIRIYYDFPIERATLEYLIIMKVFEFCREWNLPLQPLHNVSDIFTQKERIGSVQEI